MKKTFITGASAGIGRATTLALLEKGHHCLAVARRMDKLKELSAEAGKLSAGKLEIAELDICDATQIDAFFEKHQRFFEGLDCLVNNAGLALGQEQFQKSDFHDVEVMIETNVTALLRISRKILPFMIARKKGILVNLGSVAGSTPYPGGAVYCATKAAVKMMTDALRYDVGGTNVRISTISPGRVETDFSLVRFKGDQERAVKIYQGLRCLTAEDIARSIVWVIEQPEHVNIQDILIMPTDQPSATSVFPF